MVMWGVGVLMVCRGLKAFAFGRISERDGTVFVVLLLLRWGMNIRKGWDSFCSLVAFKVGDGANIKFWFDTWCGRTPLEDVFPELFGIANNKESSVAKLLSSLGNGFNWNVNFVRRVQDWELESVVTFVDLIYSGLARGNGVDQ